MKVEVTIIRDGEEIDAWISGFFGSYCFGDGVGVAQLIGAESPYLDHIIKAVDDGKDGGWIVMADVKYVEPEMHYGTAEGDIGILPGYYMVGDIVKTKRQTEEQTA